MKRLIALALALAAGYLALLAAITYAAAEPQRQAGWREGRS